MPLLLDLAGERGLKATYGSSSVCLPWLLLTPAPVNGVFLYFPSQPLGHTAASFCAGIRFLSPHNRSLLSISLAMNCERVSVTHMSTSSEGFTTVLISYSTKVLPSKPCISCHYQRQSYYYPRLVTAARGFPMSTMTDSSR